MANELNGARVAFITSNEGIEQAELVEPWKAVEQAGGRPELLAKEAGEAQAFNHLDKADKFPVDHRTSKVSATDYDGLVLPGGVPNGDQVRMDPAAVELVKGFFEAGKPVAVICHGGWVLVEAGVVRGRTMTSWPSLQTDIRNAGGTWVDKELQVCTGGPNTLISSRKPDDLPAFCSAIVEHFAKVNA
ncbi:MAG TPA: type 1 glutamine amidotransferase domain-containing protein [Acidimicrobiales bacterium]|nr:type 1 glutamine amidotransferase domain-containing protein [Acidimicrobiales bacterium]